MSPATAKLASAMTAQVEEIFPKYVSTKLADDAPWFSVEPALRFELIQTLMLSFNHVITLSKLQGVVDFEVTSNDRTRLSGFLIIAVPGRASDVYEINVSPRLFRIADSSGSNLSFHLADQATIFSHLSELVAEELSNASLGSKTC